MEDWDSIDWDEKVEDIIKNQQKNQEPEQNQPKKYEFLGQENDGNYFEANQEKKKRQQQKPKSNDVGPSKKVNQEEDFIQPYSYKDLQRIREYLKSSTTFHNLILETFGQFERFLMTHESDLTHDALVELLIIDSSLIEIPFQSHNQVLLREISKIESFWTQLIQFLEEFLTTKHQDVKFLLVVDMHTFFDNIESLLHNLIINNMFSEGMEKICKEIVGVMERFVGNKWSCGGRLRKNQENYERNRDVYKIYEVRFRGLCF